MSGILVATLRQRRTDTSSLIDLMYERSVSMISCTTRERPTCSFSVIAYAYVEGTQHHRRNRASQPASERVSECHVSLLACGRAR